ncbi:coiled-coil domain-containing protein 137-like isoform 6-T9 [Syngnathus typhle]
MEMESKHVLFLTNNQVERKPELNEDKQEKPANGGRSDKMKAYNKLKLLKRQRKKLERQEVRMEKEMFQDDIAFGEVSTEPHGKCDFIPLEPRLASTKAMARAA